MSPLTLPDGRVIPDSERTRCETWSRVMGYFRPLREWNAGKQAEHRERVPYRYPESKQGRLME